MAFTNDDDSGLEGNVDELLMSAIEENEKLQNKIISLKVENEETKRREDLLKNKIKEKEEVCEEHEAEIVYLRKELEKIKKGWESSQILDTILNNKKTQREKSGIGFKGESSSTKNNSKSYADVLSNNPKEERLFHQRPISDPNNEERVTPRKNVDSNHVYYNRYKTIFFGHCFYCKNFGHQARHCMACKNETPKFKDQTNKPYHPKGQGQINTYNSFDPLAKFDLIFSLCNDNGHNEQNCPLKRRKEKNENPNTDKCCLALCAHNDENHWFVDSGCSRHMTGTKGSLSHWTKRKEMYPLEVDLPKLLEKELLPLLMEKEKLKMPW